MIVTHAGRHEASAGDGAGPPHDDLVKSAGNPRRGFQRLIVAELPDTLTGASTADDWRPPVIRDASINRSPNAGIRRRRWPALIGLALAGAGVYGGVGSSDARTMGTAPQATAATSARA